MKFHLLISSRTCTLSIFPGTVAIFTVGVRSALSWGIFLEEGVISSYKSVARITQFMEGLMILCDVSFMKKIRSRSDAKEEKSRVGRSF